MIFHLFNNKAIKHKTKKKLFLLNATLKSQGINHAETWAQQKQGYIDYISYSEAKENFPILHGRSGEWSLSNGAFWRFNLCWI